MGDVSIIARRLADGHVQYGWSGNGGYYRSKGDVLLRYYTRPELVEYLFGLGEVSDLWEPYSERLPGRIFKTAPTGRPHRLGTTEREIFSGVVFADYGYFYDLDKCWYYIYPGPLRIKIPLALVSNHLDNGGDEFEFLYSVISEAGKAMLGKWYREDPDFREHLSVHGASQELVKQFYDRFAGGEPGWRVLEDLWEKHRSVLAYFDDWVVVKTDTTDREITEIVLRRKEEPRMETICW